MSFSRYHDWGVLNSAIFFLLYHCTLRLGKTCYLCLVDGLSDHKQLLPDLIEKTILQYGPGFSVA